MTLGRRAPNSKRGTYLLTIFMEKNLIHGAMISITISVSLFLLAIGDLARHSMMDLAKQKNYTLHVFWLCIGAIFFTLFFWTGDIVKIYLGMF